MAKMQDVYISVTSFPQQVVPDADVEDSEQEVEVGIPTEVEIVLATAEEIKYRFDNEQFGIIFDAAVRAYLKTL